MDTSASPANPNTRASDVVVLALEADILSGDLADASRLPAERDLMERFQTSRTVVREAIAKLGSRGLLRLQARHRPVVRKPSFETALESMGATVRLMVARQEGVRTLFESRMFVERGLVRDAATSATKPDMERLRDALKANESAVGKSSDFYATDSAFHGVLYTIPKNPIFPSLHLSFTSWLAPHWQKMLRSPERNLVNFRAHEAIFVAIQERDPDAAEQALEAHLNAAWEYVRVTFDGQAH